MVEKRKIAKTYRLDRELADRVDKAAKDRGISRTEVISVLIGSFLPTGIPVDRVVGPGQIADGAVTAEKLRANPVSFDDLDPR